MTDLTTVGDLARQLVARRQNADLRAEMDKLVNEVGSGRRSDLSSELKGNFTLLSELQAELSRNEAYAGVIQDLEGRAASIQLVLSTGREMATEVTARLAGTSPPTSQATVSIVASEARGRFADFTARLNAGYAGSALFAGIATSGAAVASSEDLFAALETAVSGLTTAEEVETAVRDWFAPGGDFDTLGYLGDLSPIPEIAISKTRKIALDVTAADPAIREILTGMAMAALADRSPPLGDLSEQSALMIMATEQLQVAQVSLSNLQGRLGTTEAELERQRAQNAAETTALTESQAALTDVDIFESATELEAVQARLELLYAITARSAQLSLVRVLG